MCATCGCGENELVTKEVHTVLLSENDRIAAHNREHFRRHGVLAINVMGSPGSGKTALLEATARHFGSTKKICALSGDLATDLDAARLSSAGISARSITTGSVCHLNAQMVHQELHRMDWQNADILFLENVGNLVCPAIFDLGQAVNVVVLSVTEGEDKPLKYPVMFLNCQLVILSKIDLLPSLPSYRLECFEKSLSQTMPEPFYLPVSAQSGQGMDNWLDKINNWLGSALPQSVTAP